jgi:spore germination protein YaaH
VSVIEARGLASTYGARLERGPTGTLFFRYVAGGETHELWFDDTESTGRALGAFAESLPSDVGILYYGLGAEDPTLFSTLAERTR